METAELKVNGAAKTNAVEALPTYEVPEDFLALDLRTTRPPLEALENARDAAIRLREFLEKTKAVQFYGTSEHVMNEGWLFIASLYGCTPVGVGEPEYVEFGDAHGFRAVCECVQIATGRVVGRATAYCMTDEDNWQQQNKYRKETVNGKTRKVFDGTEPVPHFKRASMAQTRASSKAMTIFKWVVKVAGYSPTPAEEVDNASSVAPGSGDREPTRKGSGGGRPASAAPTEPAITDKQWRRLWAIYRNSGLTKAEFSGLIGCPVGEMYVRSKQVATSKYESLIEQIEGKGKQ
jgi:hypothetical protein